MTERDRSEERFADAAQIMAGSIASWSRGENAAETLRLLCQDTDVYPHELVCAGIVIAGRLVQDLSQASGQPAEHITRALAQMVAEARYEAGPGT